jgi:tryptophan synthase alpha chain
MADPIAAAFATARAEGRAALMPYLMGGFPDAKTAAAVADAYAEAGADLVELGIPFSDPLADGPVIHSAATRALANGATLTSTLALCERIADLIPVVPMVYANMALAHGPERFARELTDAGAAGAIVPDLPVDESTQIATELRAAGLALIPLIAPTTPPERRARIAAEGDGFVYLVSDTRTTGERTRLPLHLGSLIDQVKADSPIPVAVGFGITTPEQAAEVGHIADGVIIGSRLVRLVSESSSASEATASVSSFIRDCRERMSAGGMAS